jgi:hypothetical protein
MSAHRLAVKPIKAWAIVDETGEIRINQLRKTKEAAKRTLAGWQYQGRRYRIILVEVRPLPLQETEGD